MRKEHGIFYPVLAAGTEQADIDAGKYGRMWIEYMKDEYPVRYRSLVRFAELEERAAEVNETAYELLDDIENSWLKKHKPKKPGSFRRTATATDTGKDDGGGDCSCRCGNAVSLEYILKSGGVKCRQNAKVGAESATKMAK